MAGVVALSALGAAPAMGEDGSATADYETAAECRGGYPDYWLSNPWPKPFLVPKQFRQPNGKRAIVRKWTKFDAVFRYRGGKDAEGAIFPGKTLNQVLKMKGNAKKGAARQTIAALLNAAEPNNDFGESKWFIIRNFQVYWDGTADMGKYKARKFLKDDMIRENAQACD